MRFPLVFLLIAAMTFYSVVLPAHAQQGGKLAAPNDALGLDALSSPASAATTVTTTTTTSTPASNASGGILSPSNPDYAIPGMPETQPQNDDDADPLKSPVFQSLSPDLQKQILDEAQGFYNDCTGKPSYAAMHNCECLSVHFTNERLRRPTDSTTKIGTDIEKDCVDVVATAGYAYNDCMRIYATIYPQHLQKICECYGNTFARAYAKNAFPQSDYMIKLGVEAASKCHDDIEGNGVVPPQPPPSVIPPTPNLDNLKP